MSGVVTHFATPFVIRWPLPRGYTCSRGAILRSQRKGGKGFIRDALLNPQSKCDAWILRKGGRDSRIYELAWSVIYVKSSRFPWNLEQRKRFNVFRFIKRRMNFSLSRAWNKNMQKRLTPLLEATVLGLSPVVNTAWVKPDDQPGLKRNFALPASWRAKWNEIWSIPMAS